MARFAEIGGEGEGLPASIPAHRFMFARVVPCADLVGWWGSDKVCQGEIEIPNAARRRTHSSVSWLKSSLRHHLLRIRFPLQAVARLRCVLCSLLDQVVVGKAGRKLDPPQLESCHVEEPPTESNCR